MFACVIHWCTFSLSCKLISMPLHAEASLLMQTLFSVLLKASHSPVPALTRPSRNREMGNAVLALIRGFQRDQRFLGIEKRLCVRKARLVVNSYFWFRWGGVGVSSWLTLFCSSSLGLVGTTWANVGIFLVQTFYFFLFLKWIFVFPYLRAAVSAWQ